MQARLDTYNLGLMSRMDAISTGKQSMFSKTRHQKSARRSAVSSFVKTFAYLPVVVQAVVQPNRALSYTFQLLTSSAVIFHVARAD